MRATPVRLSLGVLFCLGLSLALTACGSSSQCNGCNFRTSPPQQTFLIAAGQPNSHSSQLLSFSVDSTTGALGAPLSIAGPASPLTGAPLTALTAAQGMPFVYVSPQSPDFPEQVYGYSVNASTGALTEIASSPYTAESTVGLNSGFALNNFLYLGAAAQLTDGLAPAVEAFSIGSDGALSPSVAGSPFPIIPPGNDGGGNGPPLSARSPYVYAAAYNGASGIAAFSIDQQTGVLTEVAGSPFPITAHGASGVPGYIVLDPYGFLYVTVTSYTLYGQDYIAGFLIDNTTGALTPVPGSPFAVNPFGFSGLALDLSGHYLFTAAAPDTIQEFQVNTSTGALTPMANTSAPIFGQFEVVGDYLYVPNSTYFGSSGGPSAIAAFSIDGSTGALAQVPGSPFAAGVPIVGMTAVTLPTPQ